MTITYDDALATILRICDENPDRVNPLADNGRQCTYLSESGERCIAGQWFHEMGVPDTEFVVGAAGGGASAFLCEFIDRGLLALDDDFSRQPVMDLLDGAQWFADNVNRDRGVSEPIPWGVAGRRLRNRPTRRTEDE